MTRPWTRAARVPRYKRRTKRCSGWTIDSLAASICHEGELCGYITFIWILLCRHFCLLLFPFLVVYCGVGPGGVGTGTASVCTESWKIQNISEKIYDFKSERD